jgi:hypothetical protein
MWPVSLWPWGLPLLDSVCFDRGPARGDEERVILCLPPVDSLLTRITRTPPPKEGRLLGFEGGWTCTLNGPLTEEDRVGGPSNK